MTVLVLDSGAVSHLGAGDAQALQDLRELAEEQLWPPVVPSVVLAESVSGRPSDDVVVHRFLKSCSVHEVLPRDKAQRAGALRTKAGCGSVVDAIVVALAEPGGTVLTEDIKDIAALAQHADRVSVMTVKPRRRAARRR